MNHRKYLGGYVDEVEKRMRVDLIPPVHPITAPDETHGTLCDENGNPKKYRALHPSLPSIPLAEAAIWPDRMLSRIVMRDGKVVREPTNGRCEADGHIEQVEKLATKHIGSVPCPGHHGYGGRCNQCGAWR